MRRLLAFVAVGVFAFVGIFAVKQAAGYAITNEKTRNELNDKVGGVATTVASTLLAGIALLVTNAVSKSNGASVQRENEQSETTLPPRLHTPRPHFERVSPNADLQTRVKQLEQNNKRLEVERAELQSECEELEKKCRGLISKCQALRRDLNRVKSFARGKLAVFYGMVMAIILAWSWPLTAWIETAVYQWVQFDPNNPGDLLARNFALYYLQTILLAAVAGILGFVTYWRFFRRTQSPTVSHTFVIGYVGIAACGLVSLLLMNPRMWGGYFTEGGLVDAAYIGIPRVAYIGIQRLLLLPLAGYFGCLISRQLFVRQRRQPIVAPAS